MRSIQKIYIENCASTNELLKSELPSEDIQILYSYCQTNGKGQLGRKWESECGKNIALSMRLNSNLLDFNSIDYSKWTANVVRNFLSEYSSEKVKIKWPNDIIITNSKVSGILIENSKDSIIIGVGINVNQTHFEELPNASSIGKIENKTFHLELLVEKLSSLLMDSLEIKKEEIAPLYNYHLYKKNGEVLYRIADLDLRKGVIRKVDEKGALVIESIDNQEYHYQHSEIEILNWFD